METLNPYCCACQGGNVPKGAPCACHCHPPDHPKPAQRPRILRSLVELFGPAVTDDDRYLQPVIGMPVSYAQRGSATILDGRIVGLLANAQNRRIVLVELDEMRAPGLSAVRALWFVKRPEHEDAAEIATFSTDLQQVCFPIEGGTAPAFLALGDQGPWSR